MINILTQRKNILFLFLVVLIANQASSVSAGNNVWTNIGLEGKSVYSLVVDQVMPSTIYAGTQGNGVFKSTDSGGNWIAVNNGLPLNAHVGMLALDPKTPSILYVTIGDGRGVFKSTDGGENWNAVNNGLTKTDLAWNVQALAIDPVNTSTLYAGTTDTVLKIFKSTNSGENWTPINNGLVSNSITSILVDPLTPTTLYIGTSNGVYKSSEGGELWVAINSGMSTSHVTNILSLALDPLIPSTLYAGTWGDGLYKSTNSGDNWSPINNGLTITNNTYFSSLVIDSATPTTLYAGIYRDGVFKSMNSGENWTAVNNGLTNTYVVPLAIDPATNNTLYAGTMGGGVFVATINTYILSGQITLNGIGLADVNLTIGNRLTTTTASDGSFTFYGLLPGDYTITPSSSEYVFSPTSQSVTLNADMLTVDFIATSITYNAPPVEVNAPSDPSQPVPVSLNTPLGNILIELEDVRTGGTIATQVTVTSPTPAPSLFTLLGVSFDITSLGVNFGRATVHFSYRDFDVAAAGVLEESLRLLHYENGKWKDITTDLDTTANVITGITESFSPFVIGVQEMQSCAISLNNGAVHTGHLNVQIFSNMPGAAEMLVSNDAGFTGAHWQPYHSALNWTITDPGNRIVNLLVHARLRDSDHNLLCGSTSLIDDIIYDPLAPSVVSITVQPSQVRFLQSKKSESITLLLSTEDQSGGSGVADVQVSLSSDFTGARWQSFSPTAQTTAQPCDRVYARVRDGVGNISSSANVSIPGKCYFFLPLTIR